MMVRVHPWGEDPNLDGMLKTRGEVDTDAYTLRKDPDEIIWLVDVRSTRHLIRILNHEALHLVLNRIGHNNANVAFDRISNWDNWAERGSIGGL